MDTADKTAQRMDTAEDSVKPSEILCPVCFHRCRLKPGQRGSCRARGNIGGASVSLNYGLLTSVALDPIEKKPLAMFHPGSMILSVGSFGCNLHCPFCQNWEISQQDEQDIPADYVSPEQLAALALREKENGHGNIGVAFTYNEPMIGWEYVRDTAEQVRALGMQNVLVTNGSVVPAVLQEVLPFIDAMNIDLKAFSKHYYDWIGGDLETVKTFIQLSAAAGCHVELTTLIVPQENDTDAEMEQLASWIASVGRGIPLHVTRSFPRYKTADKTAADPAVVRRLASIAAGHLDHVFTGNL